MTKTNDKRLREIQHNLVKYIESELHEEDDFMFVATMLLKHSVVLYRTFLTDEQICKMLDHVGKTMNDASHNLENYVDIHNNPPTIH